VPVSLPNRDWLCNTEVDYLSEIISRADRFRRVSVKAKKFWPVLIPGLLLVLCFAVALVIRVVLPYSDVFTSNGIVFTGNDAYYHMRVAEGLVNNFPRFPGIDPYLVYPGGVSPVGNFFQWLIALVVWVIGFGAPTEHSLNAIGAWIPAVLGALTVIPAFFIAKELWGKHGKWAGLVGALLVAVLPGEFLGRSIIGFTDQHVAETLLSTTAVMFLVFAVKSARLRELSLAHIRHMRWDKVLLPGLYSILSGLLLGLYIFSWQGALLVVFTIALFFVFQFINDHLHGRSTEYLAIVGTLLFLISLLFLPVSEGNLYVPSLVIAVLIPVVLGIASFVLAKRKVARVVFPAALVVFAAAGLGLFYLVQPALLKSMFAAFNIFTPSGTLLATIEAQSIFTPLTAGGGFLSSPAWINFYLTLPVALLGLLILLIHGVVKQGNAEKCAVVVWTMVMLVATIGQRRFAYYFAVNVALLAGYVGVLVYYVVAMVLDAIGGDSVKSVSGSLLDLDGWKTRRRAAEETAVSGKKRSSRRERKIERRRELERRKIIRDETRTVRLVRDYISIGLSVVLVFMLLFSQLVLFSDRAHGLSQPPTFATASSTPYAPSAGWVKALTWMRANTPEPLGSADAYLRNYPAGAGFNYPQSAYGVISWWDYGYWITYIAHRIPNANPGQDPAAVKRVADFLTAQDEPSADAMAADMKSAYVILDYQTASSKFWAVATWSGKSPDDFFEVYWDPAKQQQQLYIYPTYYRSMAVRMYSFNGTAQAGISPLVVQYTIRTTAQGSYKEVVSEKPFATYEEAAAFIQQQTSKDYAIVGTDPLISPVPLEALAHYRPVYEAETTVSVSSSRQTPEIAIFERSP
jgi:dolichyl-phosphooligosaccharide-protein glycotransferase